MSSPYNFYTYNGNSWTMASAPYDGVVCANSVGMAGAGIGIKLNEVQMTYNTNADYGVGASSSIPFKKGDKIEVTYYVDFAWIWFYENRDYSNR